MQPSARELAEFNGLLASVVDRGLPLAPAVELMAGVVRDRRLQEALRGTSRALAEGAPLHEALARFPRAFPPDYCALVRAGVESGRLAEVLRTAQAHQSLRARLRSKMRRAALYVLAGAIIGELVLGIAVVAGRFFEDVGRAFEIQMELKERNPLSEMLSSLAQSGGILLLIWPASFAVAAVLYKIVQRRASLGWIGYLLPFWGGVQKSRDLALFCGTLGLRLRSGTPMGPALGSARDAISNRRFRRIADGIIARVGEGESLSAALFYAAFFPKTLAWGISLWRHSPGSTRPRWNGTSRFCMRC